MRIALLGYGLEAKSAHHFLREKFPNAFFDIYDQNKEAKIDLLLLNREKDPQSYI